MMKTVFAACVVAVMALSCVPRMEERAPRYDQTQCPFCLEKPGTCTYCDGSKLCSFCKGTGERKTIVIDIPDEGIKGGAAYHEQCPYCKGKKTCRYCEGQGKCWACKGDGKIKNWDYFSAQVARQTPAAAPAVPAANAAMPAAETVPK
jgi:RecJ-like exonuclease